MHNRVKGHRWAEARVTMANVAKHLGAVRMIATNFKAKPDILDIAICDTSCDFILCRVEKGSERSATSVGNLDSSSYIDERPMSLLDSISDLEANCVDLEAHFRELRDDVEDLYLSSLHSEL